MRDRRLQGLPVSRERDPALHGAHPIHGPRDTSGELNVLVLLDQAREIDVTVVRVDFHAQPVLLETLQQCYSDAPDEERLADALAHLAPLAVECPSDALRGARRRRRSRGDSAARRNQRKEADHDRKRCAPATGNRPVGRRNLHFCSGCTEDLASEYPAWLVSSSRTPTEIR